MKITSLVALVATFLLLSVDSGHSPSNDLEAIC